MNYSGSDWIEKQLPYVHPDMEMSELGKNVADLLGELFFGIYHLDHKALYKVDWSNKHHICFNLAWRDLSTFDYDDLTRLVFLAHHMAIRVEIEGARNKILRLIFHQRSRNGDRYNQHPTLDEAVNEFKATVTIPEYKGEDEGSKCHAELCEAIQVLEGEVKK